MKEIDPVAEKDLQEEDTPMPVSLPEKCEAVYSYRDPDGNEYARTYRYPDRCPDRKADPYRLDGEAWVHRAPEKRWPYRAETLNDDGRKVLIVEGEKCADAAAGKLKDWDVLSWMGGTGSVHKTDWHCLDGRHVILWPDADHPGVQVTWIMLKKLEAVGAASYSIILPEADRPPTWDCADAIEKDGWDVQRIESYLQDQNRKHLIWMHSEEVDTVLTQLKGFGKDTAARDLLSTLEQMAATVDGEPEDTCQAVREDALKIGKDRQLTMSAKMVDAAINGFPKKKTSLLERLSKDFPKPPAPARVEPPPVHQDPVDGVALMNELSNVYKRFLWLEHPEDYDLAILWAIWTWFAYDGAEVCPLFGIVSPEAECGKSRVLDLFEKSVKNPEPSVNTTPAALFRIIEQESPTLLLDEAEASIFPSRKNDRSEEMRGMLNAGHKRNGQVPRVPREGGDGEKVNRFSVWGPKAYAAINKTNCIPETIRRRSITIRMRRKPRNIKISRWRESRDPGR